MENIGDIIKKKDGITFNFPKRAEAFTKVPNEFLISENYSAYEKLVLIVIKMHQMGKRWCWPSIKTISNEVGCSESTVKKSIKSLLAKDILKKQRRGFRSNKYSTNL